MQSGGYKQRNRRRGGGCSLQNFPVNTTTESFLSSLAIPFSPSCSFCSGAIFWHLPSSLRSWPGGESMKGIRYYYTACLPPAYRKGGRSSSLIGSQFFGRRGMEEVGWRRPVRLWAARAHGLALSVEAEEDRGSISLPRPWARTKEPPPICLPPSMPKEVQKRSAVPTFPYGEKVERQGNIALPI